MTDRVILDLCAGSGAWSEPYVEAGYDVRRITLPEHDVCTYQPPSGVWGVLAAPPCTEFAVSGARWWADKPPQRLHDALAVVLGCLRIIATSQPRWWALEQPEGRLRTYLGPPRLVFDPCDFGDPYTKRTLLWGRFTRPVPLALRALPEAKSRIHYAAPGPQRAALRSITPPAFSQAFFESNP